MNRMKVEITFPQGNVICYQAKKPLRPRLELFENNGRIVSQQWTPVDLDFINVSREVMQNWATNKQ